MHCYPRMRIQRALHGPSRGYKGAFGRNESSGSDKASTTLDLDAWGLSGLFFS